MRASPVAVLAALSRMEREYIRDRTLEGHESACTRGKTIGGAAVTGDALLGMALHLRAQGVSPRNIAARLVITKGKKKGPASLTRHRDAHAARSRHQYCHDDRLIAGHRDSAICPPIRYWRFCASSRAGPVTRARRWAATRSRVAHRREQ